MSALKRGHFQWWVRSCISLFSLSSGFFYDLFPPFPIFDFPFTPFPVLANSLVLRLPPELLTKSYPSPHYACDGWIYESLVIYMCSGLLIGFCLWLFPRTTFSTFIPISFSSLHCALCFSIIGIGIQIPNWSKSVVRLCSYRYRGISASRTGRVFHEPLLPTCCISVTMRWPDGRSSLGSVPNWWSVKIYSQIAIPELGGVRVVYFPSHFMLVIRFTSLTASTKFSLLVQMLHYSWVWEW